MLLPLREEIGETHFTGGQMPRGHAGVHEIIFFRVPPHSKVFGCVVLSTLKAVVEGMENAHDYRIRMSQEFLSVALAKSDPSEDVAEERLIPYAHAVARH